MTMSGVAKVSAVYMLVAMLAGIGLSVWPETNQNYAAAQFDTAPRFLFK